jgi:hypothetical protein
MHACHARRCAALSAAITSGLFSDDTPSAMFMDLDQLAATIHHIQHDAGYPGEAYGSGAILTQHTSCVQASTSAARNCHMLHVEYTHAAEVPIHVL